MNFQMRNGEFRERHIRGTESPRKPLLIKHSQSLANFQLEAKVMVLHTGGTIGMMRNAQGLLVPYPKALERKIRATITLHDEDYLKMWLGHRDFLPDQELNYPLPLVLPDVSHHKRVIYTIFEYDRLLDSSNMTMDDWIKIAEDISCCYDLFDGFVILHGTDTMAYTASALSFMLENLGKPVILTGSQIPFFEARSDARDNMSGALILAGNYDIPEVTIYFKHMLMRGNRTFKISSEDVHAFASPNMPVLAKSGIDIEVNGNVMHRPNEIKEFKPHIILNRNVALLWLFPSIQVETLAHFLQPPFEGVVLLCYGAGNIPSNRKEIIAVLADATERGIIIISVTQCAHGGVKGIYETGRALLNAGVIPGNDITTEAALTKLSYVLSKDEWSLETKREKMMSNLKGEMTIFGGQKHEKMSYKFTTEMR